MSVVKQLIAARCNVDLQAKNGCTALQAAEGQGHAGIATLIRNKKQETPLLGRRVVINELVAQPELNWRTGTAVSFDDEKGRYSVELDGTTSSFMIKPCNLLPTVCALWLYVACGFRRHYTDLTQALLMKLFYCRLAPSRPKSSRKVLIGPWKIITKITGKVSRKQRRETAARPEENCLSHRNASQGAGKL
jgi:hypothetical protein